MSRIRGSKMLWLSMTKKTASAVTTTTATSVANGHGSSPVCV
ncbi:hypothetical protein [Shimazuella kribbensis]|nr:hypothetical protein [Shimazuella kribbensis]